MTTINLVERLTTAIYTAPAGTIPLVPEGETADRVEMDVVGIRFVWRRDRHGSTYRRWAGPIGWLADEFERELLGDAPEGHPV